MEFSWKAFGSFFKENKKMEKLSDKITYDAKCLEFMDELTEKMKEDLLEVTKKACYDKDQAIVDKATLMDVLHNYRKRLIDFVEQPPP